MAEEQAGGQLQTMDSPPLNLAHFHEQNSKPLFLLQFLHNHTTAANQHSFKLLTKLSLNWKKKYDIYTTLYLLQYSGSLQWDSLRGDASSASNLYLIEEQDEVKTTLFTLLAFLQDFSTFNVPFMHGSIKFSWWVINVLVLNARIRAVHKNVSQNLLHLSCNKI